MGTGLQLDPPVAPPVQRPFNTTRKTKGGRELLYRATILQEPERARACGAGLKSTNDRRPVDPPPVVELRIFDITGGRERDITFTYNANFFIFTSLKLARPVAHGRVQTPAATSPPVLTGVPCSGIAYLDRPEEAGYFLFPDLSVRHEGRYKLAFTLYEETKEAADFDIEDTETLDTQNFAFRMEIESEPFTVYSAKKFPGLSESTALSRNLSDQGVRVRIRRDVRMRRRDNKAGGGGGGGGDAQKPEGEFARRQGRTPERQQPIDDHQQRPMRANSEQGRMPYEPSRRPSGAEYPVAPAPPPPSGYSTAPSGNLDFGPRPHYVGRPPIAPSPTTPTFSSGRPSPGLAAAPSGGLAPIKAEAQLPPVKPEPHIQHGIPASPRMSHRHNASQSSLPGIHTLLNAVQSLQKDDTIAVDTNPAEEPQNLPGAGSKRRHDDMSRGLPLEPRYRSEDSDRSRYAPRPMPMPPAVTTVEGYSSTGRRIWSLPQYHGECL